MKAVIRAPTIFDLPDDFVAQASIEGLTIVSHDDALSACGVLLPFTRGCFPLFVKGGFSAPN